VSARARRQRVVVTCAASSSLDTNQELGAEHRADQYVREEAV